LQRRTLLVTSVLALLSPLLVAAAASAATASLEFRPQSVTYGEVQQAAGTVQADAPCASGRTVNVQQRPVGATTWTDLASATSGSDGTFSVSLTPQTNASYRAVVAAGLLAGVMCDQITSPVRKGRVLAAVGLQVSSSTVRAGECVAATATVQPAKTGQQVRLQQQESKGWTTLDTLTLNGSSRAATSVCEGWPAVGHRIELRVIWPKQDPSNAAGESGVSDLTVVEAPWMTKIDGLTRGRSAGVSITAGGKVLYTRSDTTAFAPASNEKLLLSMALLDRLGPGTRIATDVAATGVNGGVVHGNLWILGHGDPSTGKREMTSLASELVKAGLRKVTGRVMGSTGYFAHDWWAPGWKSTFPADEVGVPSALTFNGNHIGGRNVPNPERYAADSLTNQLRKRGAKVAGKPGSGVAPAGLQVVATLESPTLAGLMTSMDQNSDNFFAEVLGKRLGVEVSGVPGTIARGAAAIAAWARSKGVVVHANDSSGLSYRNRVTPGGITTLLQAAEQASWGDTLRSLLPDPSQGTMAETHSLQGVQVHAKTGTLVNASALSGWVWLQKTGEWAQFSILDRGMCSCQSKPMEDAIVRTVFKYGH
jgi:D-alanyl-D-alanine carboxypeptidase/D-alanyl-D-alanine-endopeptidase (penicillin-binding protein 4)